MPQVNFNVMVSIDWLECFCMVDNPISQEPPATTFAWKQRQYGSRIWEHIYEVWILQDGVFLEPFAVVCAGLRGKLSQPCACSVKIENEQLYKPGMWDRFAQFRALYGIQIKNISRCDLAADFIYLAGRVSGRQLVRNIKELRWWKCGTVKCSEHYSLPYAVQWAMNPADMELDTYGNAGESAIRVESLTFGTKASFAQVCIYDKTLELQQHEINGIAEKEYIRDAWKQAGCYDPKRHTWRVEIRLSSKAMTMTDPFAKDGLRPVRLADLYPERLNETFFSAQDTWFRLIDVSQGNPNFKRTPDFCRKYRKRKNEFRRVKLFQDIECLHEFTTRPHQSKASRFVRAMINRLDDTANQFDRKELLQIHKSDPHTLRSAAQILRGIYSAEVVAERKAEREQLFVDQYISLLRELQQRKMFEGDDMEVSSREMSLLAFLTSPDGPLTKEQLFKAEHDGEICLFDVLPDDDADTLRELNLNHEPAAISEYQVRPWAGDDIYNDFLSWSMNPETY